MTDTEALKALVAKWRKEAWHGPGETQYRMGRGHSADELESALERMLASQGEPAAFLLHRPPGAYGKKTDVVLASMYDPRKSEFWLGGSPPPGYSFEELYTAPPLAEPDVEAMAKEITQLFVGLDGFPGISASAGQDLEIKVEAIIRKHLRPAQQTEGEWVRVPREPTEEMRTAAVNVGYEGDMDQFRGDWAAMVAAAPQAEGK